MVTSKVHKGKGGFLQSDSGSEAANLQGASDAHGLTVTSPDLTGLGADECIVADAVGSEGADSRPLSAALERMKSGEDEAET